MFDINEFWGERKALQEAFKIDYDNAIELITNVYKNISAIENIKNKNVNMFVKIFISKKIENRNLRMKDMERYFLDFQKQEEEFDELAKENGWELMGDDE